jgi:transposase
VRLALRNFRNKTGFHECPQCKSRSVWRADPHGTLEETLHLLLRVAPYRCARCDKRFMDSKTCAADAPAPRTNRWFAYARSTASRVLKSAQRTPFEEALKLNSIFAQSPEKRDARLQDSVER